ncbi:glycosyl transferase [Capsaspora owczarzaki ATCC 30864]|nr:glycosyl transferase [Capsaspora owczarzaki ATCC 30864]|eukprot:XP_004349028.2 glycosyl transferase [Capsaspora owczarzaki ATCC 30864]
MGFAFVLPLFRWLLRCKVGCYVHYPTISTDMIARVRDRTAAHNNSALVARYPLLSHGKLAYYRGFALLYSLVGSCAELVMVNSSWTRGHVAQLWHLDRQPVFRLGDELLAATETAAFEKHAHAAATASSTGGTTRSGKSYNTEPAAGSSTSSSTSSSSSDPTQRLRLLYASPDSRQDAFAPVFERLNKALHANAIVLYPPCNTTLLRAFPLQSRSASPATIVSVAQFRPEKDHALQVRALAEALRLQPQLRGKVRLALVGSCRHADDQARVDSLRKLAHELGVEHEVELLVGVSHEVLRAQLAGAVGGMHTMWNEHFGIGVVEYMAAGAVAIAHHSGGPLMDIVTPFRGQPTGYLATTKEEYAQAILALLAMKDSERHAMQERARASVSSRFSDEVFACGFAEAVATLVCAHR